MNPANLLNQFATGRPRLVTALMVAATAVIVALAVLPSVWPERFPMLHALKVDTDPENMLADDEPMRVFHNDMKDRLSLHEIIVVGVVNEVHPQGVFNAESLGRVYELTDFARTLRGEALGQDDPNAGVIVIDIIAPSTVDNIEQAGLGTVSFDWLMAAPPADDAEALAVMEKAARIPFLDGTLVSDDGQAVALYLPISSKDLSYRISRALQSKIAEFGDTDDQFYITGLPVAEDTFGVEMFIQMAISAPLAMLAIFLLLLLFFKKLLLIISPMIVAMVTVFCTMGLLVISGNTIHIMSSMIPIFIMPIAVLDSIHILSAFFDKYQETKDRRETMRRVLNDLFKPMLFTSLTTTAGFASLALTPIPPVQVFGIFVAIGVLLAWFLTIVFIPAYIMLIPEERLENFGTHHSADEEMKAHSTLIGRFLDFTGNFAYGRSKLVVAGALLILVIAVYGILQIRVNDNPTRWFQASHPIRVADRVLNEHFGGTYMAYLALLPGEDSVNVDAYLAEMRERLLNYGEEITDNPAMPVAVGQLGAALDRLAGESPDKAALLQNIETHIQAELGAADSRDAEYAWEDLLLFVDRERESDEIFKQPEALAYIAALQEELLKSGQVGKSNSLTDIVKTVHRELFEGQDEAFRVPDTSRGVGQTLITYQGGHRPHDLWHFTTPDFRESSIWVQLKSGDNKDMTAVAEAIAVFAEENPPPLGLELQWFGKTYLNVVWQEEMVAGMRNAFLGSFLIVFLMMAVLFRSLLWGLLSMIPLTLTIAAIYGVIGLIGKDYDMPVAVLSSLTLGLAVDFAIHFLSRSRDLVREKGSWKAAWPVIFGEPARAITRNIIVLAIGFLPLLLAPLVPYQTVGVFLASILLVSGVATLLLLPALITLLETRLFPGANR